MQLSPTWSPASGTPTPSPGRRYRYAQDQGYDVSASADLSGFPDADQIQSYATEALSWAVAEGLLQGFEDDTLQPQSTATRAQIATILKRFCEGVGA